jgi:uncharacterized protein YbaP (TraB family)
MKKRLLSLLLVMMLVITLIPNAQAFAAEPQTNSNKEIQSMAAGQTYSNWAFADLVVAEKYGLFPNSWFEKDMTVPITKAKLLVLNAGLRYKMLNTESIKSVKQVPYKLSGKLTVEEVIKYLYNTVTSYTFTKDLGNGSMKAVTFMKENGIYTGKNGELGLKDLCTIEQASVLATRLVTCIYDILDTSSKGFLWEAKANGNTVYMLGSIHMATTDIYPLSDKILAAYNSSDALAVEVNLYDQAGALALVNNAFYTDGTTLKDHVSKETYDKAIALATKFGIPEAQASLMKPWYIYISFTSLSMTESASTEEANASAILGIDMNFLTNAMLSGKKVLEVEGYAVQGKMLESFSDELAEYLVNETLDAVNDSLEGKDNSNPEALEDMLSLWRDGDTENFKQYNSFEYQNKDMIEDGTTEQEMKLLREFYDKLFINRNKTMADYIDKLLKAEGGHTYFVIVGSGHYLGDSDIIEILTDKGYEINQIK